ncbi:MAG: protein phosphatase 2C domain-containing protein [Propionibacteriaceae bacterium]|jgi:protein phosphatase|nr:protein phosphatase 2C domain-containing protein [Propionibacteriaceae bacterium]
MQLRLVPLAHSEIGLVRRSNQDSGYVTANILLVADGMGGAAAGDLASAVVATDLSHNLDASAKGQAALDSWKTAITAANQDLSGLIMAAPQLDGMGTTVCGGIFDGQELNIAHIGDSRGYRLQDGQLQRLTHDHSYVQTLIDEGRLDEAGALTHPHRSIIMRVVNGQPVIEPDYQSISLAAGDRLMFCSDGLCGLVPDAEIAMAIQAPRLAEAMTALIALAHAAGGSDNITIVLADVIDADDPNALLDATNDADPALTDAADPALTDALTDTLTDALPSPLVDPGATLITARQTGVQTDYVKEGLIGAANDPQIELLLDALHNPAEAPATWTTPLTSGRAKAHAKRGNALRQSVERRERERYAPVARRSHKLMWLIIALVLLALGGGAWGAYAYVSGQYYVGAADGHVAIYRGLPGSVAGFDTARLFEQTDIDLEDLPIAWRDQVEAVITVPGGSLDRVHDTISELERKSAQCISRRAGRDPSEPVPADGC